MYCTPCSSLHTPARPGTPPQITKVLRMWDMSYKMSFSATCVSVRMRVHGCRTCSLTTNHSTKMAAIPSGPPSSRYPSRPRSSHEETIEELKRRHKVCQSHVSCDQPGQSRVDHSAEHIPKLSSASGDLSLPLPLVVDGCDSACLDEAYQSTIGLVSCYTQQWGRHCFRGESGKNSHIPACCGHLIYPCANKGWVVCA